MMRNLRLEKIEKDFYNWIISNRHKIVLVLVGSFMLLNTVRIPYLNLFLTEELVQLLVLVLILAVFNLSATSTFKLGIMLLAPAFLLQIAGRVETAEFIGNLIYVVFLFGVFKGISKIKDIDLR